MTRTKKRRKKKQVTYLKRKAVEGSRAVRHAWNQRLQSWVEEIRRRKAMLRQGGATKEIGSIFAILEHADSLLSECGSDIERLVGGETRRVLEAECCNAVAHIYGPSMYRLIQHNWYDDKLRNLVRHRKAMAELLKASATKERNTR